VNKSTSAAAALLLQVARRSIGFEFNEHCVLFCTHRKVLLVRLQNGGVPLSVCTSYSSISVSW